MKCKNCVRHVHLNDDGERTIGTPNWCFYLSDSPDEELERDCIVFKPLTNADRIRAMSDEELAGKMFDLANYACPPGKEFTRTSCGKNPECNNCWLDWLRQEAAP